MTEVPSNWPEIVTLVVTIVGAAVSSTAFIMNKINENKEEMDERLEKMEQELSAIRMSAYEEYQELRKEIAEIATITRKEFGDTISAIREKVTQVELWTRDQLTETRQTLYGAMDQRHQIVVGKIEKVDDHVRQLELFSAAKHGYIPDKP